MTRVSRDPGEPPLAGTTIYLDLNSNGVRDLSTVLEPDTYVAGTVLNTVSPGVTLAVLDQSNAPLSFPVTATYDSFQYAPTGRLVFAHAGREGSDLIIPLRRRRVMIRSSGEQDEPCRRTRAE